MICNPNDDFTTFLIDYQISGHVIGCLCLPSTANGPLKIAQINAYRDRAKRFYIAKKLVEAKAQRTLNVMKWLGARHGELSSQVQADLTNE